MKYWTGEYLLTLLGKYDALNFFITKANGPVIIPCAGTVPQTEKLKLLKTSGENKVNNMKYGGTVAIKNTWEARD